MILLTLLGNGKIVSNPTENIAVELGGRSYIVHIESGALNSIAEHLEPYISQDKLLFITDSNVVGKYWKPIRASLAKAGVTAEAFILPAGEQSKNWQNLEAICDWLLKHGVERSDHIIALGGGVVGDIAGFASSIVKRGCNFVQIPTTLLAQVDSSVGGKTAINSVIGKNLVGLFHQPAFVLIDPDMLGSLPERELRAGYAEVVKYGLINDEGFFAWCEENGTRLLQGDEDARMHAIGHCIRAKADIVAQDERELSGTRALLNLGHTFGHALEAETGFSDILLHGEGVAAGMALAARYSVRRGFCDAGQAERIAVHLNAVGLPSKLQDIRMKTNGKTLAAHMQHDKKAVSGIVPLLLMHSIGETFLTDDVDLSDVSDFLDSELGLAHEVHNHLALVAHVVLHARLWVGEVEEVLRLCRGRGPLRDGAAARRGGLQLALLHLAAHARRRKSGSSDDRSRSLHLVFAWILTFSNKLFSKESGVVVVVR